MKKRFTILLAALVLAASALLLSSCGGDPGTGGGKTGDTVTVTWVVDSHDPRKGPEITKEEVPYGEKPEYKKKAPSGYTIACWDKPVMVATEDVTYTAVLCGDLVMSANALKAAYETPLIQYTMPKNRSDGEDRQSKTEFWNGASALLVMAAEEYNDELEGPLRDRVIAQIHSLVYGNEPMFDACCYWAYASLAAGCAMARHTPTVWDAMTEDEQERLDWIMRCFAVLGSFATADYNDYPCGPGRNGNYAKGWNPNYQFANVTPILSAVVYFSGDDIDLSVGAETVNGFLFDFKYDDYMEKFDEFDWQNVKWVWSQSSAENNNGRNLMEKGGPTSIREGALASLGTGSKNDGVGVIPPTEAGYTFKSRTLDEAMFIFEDQLKYMFGGGTIVNHHPKDAKIGIKKNGEYNPVLGLQGMMTEFFSSDNSGIRSSTTYCEHDFIMAVGVTFVYQTLGIFPEDKFGEILGMMKNGCDDLLFKREQGYMSKSNGSYYESSKSGMGGHTYIYSVYITCFSDRSIVDIP